MTIINFYHLNDNDVNKAAARLLEKIFESNQRAVVLCADNEKCQILNEYLWSFSPNSFLPHGTVKEGQAKHQPIWITADNDNPNNANIIMVVQGSQIINLKDYTRCFDLFDGSDTEAVDLARKRWKAYKESGNQLNYWQQQPDGQWLNNNN